MATRLLREDRTPEAFILIEEALSLYPSHLQALILMGEIFLTRSDHLGLEHDFSDLAALSCFELALQQEPNHADAWSGKARTLLYLDRPEDALEAVDNGLSVLPLSVGYGMTFEEVRINITESLFDVKIRALLELGQVQEANATLHQGLMLCPTSEFLSRHLVQFLPKT
jgi:tetratricopeptide (TPR) repeat protein